MSSVIPAGLKSRIRRAPFNVRESFEIAAKIRSNEKFSRFSEEQIVEMLPVLTLIKEDNPAMTIAKALRQRQGGETGNTPEQRLLLRLFDCTRETFIEHLERIIRIVGGEISANDVLYTLLFWSNDPEKNSGTCRRMSIEFFGSKK